MITIEESGMSFGPYSPGSVFQIEQSPAVQARLSPNGIKVCEFIWRSPGENIYLVEAKSSVPSKNVSIDRYNEFFSEILEKFDNSLQIVASGLLAQKPDLEHEIQKSLSLNSLSSVSKIYFYLVIPTIPDQYLPHFNDKLSIVLKRQCRIWNAEAKVVNRRFAQKAGLIQ